MRLNEGVEWAAHCLVLLAGLPRGDGAVGGAAGRIPRRPGAVSGEVVAGAGRRRDHQLPRRSQRRLPAHPPGRRDHAARCGQRRRWGGVAVSLHRDPPSGPQPGRGPAVPAGVRDRGGDAARRGGLAHRAARHHDRRPRRAGAAQAPARAMQKTTEWLAGTRSAGASD